MIEKPQLYYTVNVKQDGKATAIRVKPDGTVIKDAVFPKGKGK